MSNNEQQKQQPNVVVTYEVEGQEVKLSPSIVRNYIADNQDVTLQEYKFFVELCQARKLNPFLKEAYLIKYGTNPAQIVVAKDAILKRAISNKAFNGREQGIIVLKGDGSIENRKGTFKLPTETLVGGWARVYRKDWDHPVEITVSFDECAQRKGNGELNKTWATKGATMIEKVALVRALREAFVEDLGGMIDRDEAWNFNEEEKPKRASSSRKSEQPVEEQPEPEVPEYIEAEYEEVNLDELS